MYSFSEYLHNTSSETQLSKFFDNAGPTLESILTIENFDFELNAISEFEMSLPDSFNMHLDMILNGGALRVSQYYEELAGGKAKILEKLKHKLGEEKFEKVNESLVKLRFLLKENSLRINEQAPALQQDLGKLSDDSALNTAIDSAVDGVKTTAAKSTILGTLKGIWNMLTDDGDPLAIANLVLDLAGLIPGGWGVAADLLNATIYFYRKKPLLGAISVVSAIFPYIGDSLKLLKLGKSAKYADEFFQYLIEVPAPNVKKYFQRIPVQHQSGVIKLFDAIGEKIVSAFSKGSSILSSFFRALEKYTGLFPGVQRFFKRFGDKFESIGAKMGKVADDLKLLPKSPIRGSAAFKDLSTALSPEIGKVAGKLSLDEARGMIRLTNAEGKVVREFSEKMLTDPKLWINNPSMRGLLSVGGKSTKEILEYFNTLPKVAPKVKGALEKTFSIIHKAVRAKAAFIAFAGKELIKLATGKTPEELGMPQEQASYFATDGLNSLIDKKRKEELAAGATYVPIVTIDSDNDEDYRAVTKYQNDWAKLVGGPEIIPVLYNKFGDDEMTKEYEDFWKKVDASKPDEAKNKPVTKFGNEETVKRNEDFWKKVAKGEITRDAEGNFIQTKSAAKPVTSVVSQVPDLKKTEWYQEAFPGQSNESFKLVSFDRFNP